jgi:hypothetical protein
MKRFTITNQTFKGHIEAIYDFSGHLCRVDFTKASGLTPNMIKVYKDRISILSENAYLAFEGTPAIVTELDFEVTFQDFMREYPYKRNTHLAEAYWPKLTSAEQYQCYCAAMEYRKYCERNKSWYKTPKIAEAWLKNKEFKNDWKSL